MLPQKAEPLNHLRLIGSIALFHDSFISELRQHLQHVDADLFRVIVQPSADDTQSVRCQDAAMQLVGLVLLILLIFFI